MLCFTQEIAQRIVKHVFAGFTQISQQMIFKEILISNNLLMHVKMITADQSVTSINIKANYFHRKVDFQNLLHLHIHCYHIHERNTCMYLLYGGMCLLN